MLKGIIRLVIGPDHHHPVVVPLGRLGRVAAGHPDRHLVVGHPAVVHLAQVGRVAVGLRLAVVLVSYRRLACVYLLNE